jgi:hypothetical protein
MAIHGRSRDEAPDDQVYWREITGWPSGVTATLHRKIGALCRHGGFHRKIGITNDPGIRWRSAYRHNGWQRMHIVYRSDCHDHVCQLENQIVQRFYSEIMSSTGWYYNAVGGGGGRKPRNGPYYLYLVTAPKWSRLG